MNIHKLALGIGAAVGVVIVAAAIIYYFSLDNRDTTSQTSGPNATDTTQVQQSNNALTLEALRGAAYAKVITEDDRKELVTLIDAKLDYGVDPEQGFARGSIRLDTEHVAHGDLNADGQADAAVIIVENGGGSGTFIQLEAMLNDRGTPRYAAGTFLGDRSLIHSVAIKNGNITVDYTYAGENDPACCPTQRETATFKLQGDALVEVK